MVQGIIQARSLSAMSGSIGEAPNMARTGSNEAKDLPQESILLTVDTNWLLSHLVLFEEVARLIPRIEGMKAPMMFIVRKRSSSRVRIRLGLNTLSSNVFSRHRHSRAGRSQELERTDHQVRREPFHLASGTKGDFLHLGQACLPVRSLSWTEDRRDDVFEGRSHGTEERRSRTGLLRVLSACETARTKRFAER